MNEYWATVAAFLLAASGPTDLLTERSPIRAETDAVPAQLASDELESDADHPKILAILAHPDDEITIAPVLARIAREGGEVTIAFATSGDAGPGVSEMQPGEALAALREDEARCSASALGAPEPIFWRMGDGELASFAHHPGSSAQKLVERVATLIAEVDPDTIVTWGPDGGYGHADHRMISNAVTQIVQAMPQDRPVLLFPALPAAEDTPAELERWAKTNPDLVTHRLSYEPVDMAAMTTALNCYESQFELEMRAALPLLLDRRVWRGTVHFRQGLAGMP